jgi:hypothetical protein
MSWWESIKVSNIMCLEEHVKLSIYNEFVGVYGSLWARR